MSAALDLAAREIRRAVRTPVAYAVLGLHLFIHGVYFATLLEGYSKRSFAALTGGIFDPRLNLMDQLVQPLLIADSFSLLLLLPAITMRLMSEEWRSKTSDLLLSYPLRDIDVVLGKYLSAVALLATMVLAGTLVSLGGRFFGRVELAPLMVGQLGLFLYGLTVLAVGLFFSMLTENQVIAFTTTMVSLFATWFLGWWGNQFATWYGALLRYVSLPVHISPFSWGVLRLSDVLFFTLSAAFFLFLAMSVLESRRWRSG